MNLLLFPYLLNILILIPVATLTLFGEPAVADESFRESSLIAKGFGRFSARFGRRSLSGPFWGCSSRSRCRRC